MNKLPQTLRGSFSAVSKPIFASKYSFFSIFRDLQDMYTFAPLGSQISSKKRVQKFAKNEMKFHFIAAKIYEFYKISAKFCQNSS